MGLLWISFVKYMYPDLRIRVVNPSELVCELEL